MGNQLGISTPKDITPYNEDWLGNVKSNFKDENWNSLPIPYTFSVTSLVDGQPTAGFKDFALPLAPTELTQTEEFAISIKATQGGTVVSHSGNKYKKLRISGTTGLAPFRGSGGVDKFTGEAIGQPRSMTYQSGYHVFHELRNYFKAYYELKKKAAGDENLGKNTRLLFKNYKDGEFLIVELLTFDMKRTASKSFMYDYVLEFKVLKHYAFTQPGLSGLARIDEILNKAMNKLDVARGILLRSSAIIKQIEATYESALMEPIRKITLALKAGIGVKLDLADVSSNLAKSTIAAGDALNYMLDLKQQTEDIKNSRIDKADSKNQVLQRTDIPDDPKALISRKGVSALYDLEEGITLIDSSDLPESTQQGLEAEIRDVQDLPRSFYEDTLLDIQRIKSNAEDFFNLGSDDYDTIFGRTSTVTADSAKEITNEEIDLLQAFNEVISAIADIMSTTVLFKSDFDEQIASIVENFDDGELPLQNTAAVREIVLPAKMDLERLALKYLGNSTRWPEIAELNGLTAPFVTQDVSDTDPNVAKPGRSILIPAPTTFGFSELPVAKDIPSTVNLTKLEKSLGTDFKLTPDFDLDLGNDGDIKVVSGADNMGQAVVLKLAYEKNELIKHPSLGLSMQVGGKLRPINEYKDDIIRTLTQDTRVENIKNLSLVQENSSLSMFFEVKIKNIDIPVPVLIKV